MIITTALKLLSFAVSITVLIQCTQPTDKGQISTSDSANSQETELSSGMLSGMSTLAPGITYDCFYDYYPTTRKACERSEYTCIEEEYTAMQKMGGTPGLHCPTLSESETYFDPDLLGVWISENDTARFSPSSIQGPSFGASGSTPFSATDGIISISNIVVAEYERVGDSLFIERLMASTPDGTIPHTATTLFLLQTMNSDKISSSGSLAIGAESSSSEPFIPEYYPEHSESNLPYYNLFLTWPDIPDALYDIYLDTINPPRSFLKRDYSSTSIDTDTLLSGTTYYWQINATSNDQLKEGSVLSFTTSTSINLPPTIKALETIQVTSETTNHIPLDVSDPDGDSLIITFDVPPPYTIQRDGDTYSIEWSPESVTFGKYTTTITVSDTGTPQQSITTQVELVGDNKPQLIHPDTLFLYSEEPFHISRRGHDFEDTDIGGFHKIPDLYLHWIDDKNYINYLTHELHSAPTGMNIDGSDVTWTPSASQIGIHSVQYSITSSRGLNLSDTTTLVFKVIDIDSLKSCQTFTCDKRALLNAIRILGPGGNTYLTNWYHSNGDRRVNSLEIEFDPEITQIPVSLFALSEVSKMTLQSSSIVTIPNHFDKLSKLDTLLIKDLKLKEFPLEILEAPNLSSIDISTKTIPVSISKLTSLTRFANYAYLTSLSEELFKLPSLEYLRLYDSTTTSIPSAIKNATSLTHLFLSYASITTVPDELSLLTNLVELSLMSAPLTSLPQSMSNLTNLKKFVFSSSSDIFPTCIYAMTHLEYLFISGSFSSLSTNIGNLSYLEEFFLRGNYESPGTMSQIPSSIGDLKNLRYLLIDNHSLNSLPSSIKNLSSLSNLSITNNALTEIPLEVMNLEALTHLSLAMNNITELLDTLLTHEGLHSIADLNQINLSHNAICAVTESQEKAWMQQFRLEEQQCD